ncbi:receptor-like protein 4 [Coffea arabica]|uniref:Receptor-like protein 4 n=1 Tax=Coffea arabica TaxID=13443 RepID=A0A6P6V2F0_COFAR|nr:receptor-like protein 4 [Coffea arabica]
MSPLPLPLLLLLLLLLPTVSFSLSIPYPYNFSLHIDCGGLTNSTDVFDTTWISDRYYTGGATAVVSEPLLFTHQQEKTLRYFPISSGKKNCYSVKEVPPGKYFLRTFIAYDNYNGKSHPPSFDVAVEGTLVFSWRSPWPESISRYGAYSDLFVTFSDSDADVCFYSIATDSPVIASLELIQVDTDAYTLGNGNGFSNSSILVNYGRISSGSGQWGPGFSNDTDRFGRSWQSDAKFLPRRGKIRAISAIRDVINVEKEPNFFPLKLYQTATILVGGDGKSGDYLGYELPVDAKLDYLLWFHFAEIDVSVTKAGQRVFDIFVNDVNISRVDIFKSVGSFAAYDWSYVVKNLTNTMLSIKLVPVVGSPTICGVENYAIVPADLKTLPDQATAMRALKESLRVPDRMGWNGDPCAPTTWDAWEGVACHTLKDESALVVSQIDLGGHGLKGYISDQISLLSNLVSLNLSANSLGGGLPEGLGQKSLAKLDLSDNKFTGSIPDSLTSSNLQLVLLNDNQLDGRVPEELYSIGVHGGAIDLSGNKGLCGVPPLRDCPLFWGKDGLSTGGKVAIGLSCLFVFCMLLLAIHMCIKRRRNDYDFGLPHELMSLAAKRNRYQRQKSLMALEMESQHAKGFIPTYSSN